MVNKEKNVLPHNSFVIFFCTFQSMKLTWSKVFSIISIFYQSRSVCLNMASVLNDVIKHEGQWCSPLKRVL